jgi:hypothetical protein
MNMSNAAANDVTIGTKYNRDLDIKDVAKLVRKDIAAAIKAGKLPEGLKATVRIDRYSMGQSLDVTVNACPGIVLSTARVAFVAANPHDHCPLPRMSAHGARVLATLEAIVQAYNFDRSEPMSDYYHVNFHSTVDFADELEAAQRAEILSAMAKVA